MRKFLLAILLLSACVTPGPTTKPNDKEWAILTADYQWIQTLRAAQKTAPPDATRKQEIELALENIRRIQQTYEPFVAKVDEYWQRTKDPRAAALLASEKIYIGDQYVGVLSRYDTAIRYYREALQIDPNNPDASRRIADAERKRFVSMNSFAQLKTGMSERDVRNVVGLPREDWIKQVVQNNRVYSVWIYPRADGGASAVYFDNGVVYHTNWNAAAPPQPQAQKQ
jgi:tetratricopeptide (TPR) repeat protein